MLCIRFGGEVTHCKPQHARTVARESPLSSPTSPRYNSTATCTMYMFEHRFFINCCTHEQEERDSADLEEIEQRNALLREVHTYNRRYSGEPRTLLEMLRSWKIRIKLSFLFLNKSIVRDLPVLLRHLVHYLFSGEGLHLAFQLRLSNPWIFQFQLKINLSFSNLENSG